MSSELQRHANIRHSETAESLIETVESISPYTGAKKANDIVKSDPNLRCLPIIDGSLLIGIISRMRMLETFSRRYSHPLHGKTYIVNFMNCHPIIVSHLEILHEISSKVTTNNSNDLNADFIITKNNHYCGVGKVGTLCNPPF